MIKIGVVATKGGSGKTTLVCCLSVAAANRGRVGLLDLEPQASLSDWWDRRGQPGNPKLYTGVDTVAEAAELIGEASLDWLFVDTGPGILHKIEDVIDDVDFILVPIKASALDIVAIGPTLEVVRESGKPFLLVLNESLSVKMDATATELLSNDGFPVADQRIKQRVAYRSAATPGKTGPEIDEKCAEEIAALWSEIRTALKKVKRHV